MAKLTCPECGSTLNPAKPLAPGKKVKCPRCESVFVVPKSEDEEDFDEESARKKNTAKKAASGVKKAATPKPRAESKPEPKPPSKPVQLTDEEEEEDAKGVYGFQTSAEEEQEEDEKKPKITYAPDLTVKDPRGPATAQLISPSNWIIVHGAELFFGGVFVFALGIWPFVFSEHIVSLDTAMRAHKKEEKDRKAKEKNKQGNREEPTPPPKEDEEYVEEITLDEMQRLYPGAYKIWEELTEEKQETLTWMIVAGILSAIYGVVVAYGGVQMQNLESYNWSVACSIMVIVAGVGFGGLGIYFLTQDAVGPKFVTVIASGIFFGGWAMTKLQDQKIKEAFTFKPE